MATPPTYPCPPCPRYKEVGVEGGATSDEGAAAGGDAIGAAADELAKAGDGSLNAAGGDQAGAADSGDQAGAADSGAAADAGAAAGAAAAGGGDHGGGATAQQEALAAAAGVVGRTVVLHTQFGPIRVKLLEQLAPKTTALVWQLAQRRGCRDCAFYRWVPCSCAARSASTGAARVAAQLRCCGAAHGELPLPSSPVCVQQ